MTDSIEYITNKTGETRIEKTNKYVDISKKVGFFYIYGVIKLNEDNDYEVEKMKFLVYFRNKKYHLPPTNQENVIKSIINMDTDKLLKVLKNEAKHNNQAKELLKSYMYYDTKEFSNNSIYSNTKEINSPSFIQKIYKIYREYLSKSK